MNYDSKTFADKKAAADGLVIKSLQCTDGESDKFWWICSFGGKTCVNFGRNGTFGRFDFKQFDNADECQKHTAELIKEKARKSYTDIPVKPENGSRNAKYELINDMMYFVDEDGGGVFSIFEVAVFERVIDRFFDMVYLHQTDEKALLLDVKNTVSAFNQIEERFECIDTEEREIIYTILTDTLAKLGFEYDNDITEEWREW
jgi:predicted DNA-binding WGR domain protein